MKLLNTVLLSAICSICAFKVEASLVNKASIHISKIASEGYAPIIVTDIDETIVNSSARRLMAYKELANKLTDKIIADKLNSIKLQDIESLKNTYDSKALLGKVGITDERKISEIEKEMVDIYLSGRYTEFDTEIPCAVAFIREAMRAGSLVFFVTSRYEDTQMKSTKESLRKLGAYTNNGRGKIILRKRGMSSIDFKKRTFENIKNITNINGKPTKIVFIMENEPENMNAMNETFPNAKGIFVKGAYQKAEALTHKNLLIKNFCN